MNAEQILAKLVSFPVLGGESNMTIILWIKEYIESFGVDTVLVPSETESKASLHCRVGPPKSGGVILSGHTDVVPVKGQAWTTDPFLLTDKGDGKLYGRGACDMKGFLACCLASLPEMVEANLELPIYFAFSYDEEIGCLAAPELASHINTYYEETPKYAIIGEPSMMQPIIGQKGICVMKTEVNGSAGHSSRIRQEISAVHESARLIIWLESKMNKLVEEGRLDERFDPPHTSIHIGQMNGGIAPNIIADRATFFWDIRVIPKDNINLLLNEFDDYCRSVESCLRKVYPGFKILNTQHHPPVPPLDTIENQEVVILIKDLVDSDTVSSVSYAAEAGQFAEAGFQSVICGPGSIAQAHRADEYIEQSQLDLGVQMIQKLIKVQSTTS